MIYEYDKSNEQVENRYDAHTINSQNPFARYAHRNRIKKGLRYVIPRLELGNILDYGCGSGVFVSEINKIKPGIIFGYEPFMQERCKDGLPIYSEYNDVLKNAPYQTVTVFEVMEHLQWTDLANILIRCGELLAPGGVVIISVPIEIGPAILFKELNRYRLTKKWQYNIFEFIGAFLLGIAGRRENPDYAFMEHKGFDFRDLIRFIKSKGWKTKVLCYGPLPVKIWYGNSQVFIMAKRMNKNQIPLSHLNRNYLSKI